jgi:uncharacterized membrane protein YhiD involved in acid resistance
MWIYYLLSVPFFYRGIIYSENFGVLIVLVTGTTAFIIVTIGANLVLSLGMVGALSIVRFRAAIKEPLDIGFLFLGISAGLAAGARLYLVALLGTAVMCLVYVAMSYIRKEKRNFLLVLQYQADDDESVSDLLSSIRYKLKNKAVSNNNVELTVEVHVRSNKAEFMSSFTTADFVSSATLIEYNGDYT